MVLPIGTYTQAIPLWYPHFSDEQKDAIEAIGLRQEVRSCLIIAKDEADRLDGNCAISLST
jgi:hypothetical protein